MEIEPEDYREPNRSTPLLQMFAGWHMEGSRNYSRTAYRMECQTSLPEAYQSPTTKPKAHRQAVYRDMHQDVDREVYHKVFLQTLPS